MSDACPNCGKPVLPTDTVCWHCGHPQPRRPKTRPGGRAQGTSTGEQAADAADYDLRALAIYGLLTLAIVLSLALVMRALGRQPILVRSAALAGGNWVTLTDVELRYTVTLPSDWQWLDVAYRDQEDLLGEIIARQAYVGRALEPLGGEGDATILGVGLGTQDLTAEVPIPFVVVGQSATLRDLTPPAALDRLRSLELPVSETAVDNRLAGQPQARFDVLDFRDGYQCRHLFVADPNEAGYLVAACAPQAVFGSLRSTLGDVLDSFQLLQN